MPKREDDARIELQVTDEQRRVIEDAAAVLGQPVNDFGVSTLVQAAHTIVDVERTTRLRKRDRELFAAILDDQSSTPNPAPEAAARRYLEQTGCSGHEPKIK